MSQLILIRTDSSQKIGSGHVMRCLTLAEELRESGATVEFIVRDHQGNINQQIKNRDFKVNLLQRTTIKSQQDLTGYVKWLGVKQDIDADEAIQIAKDKEIEWLIIDHYALDRNWETKLRPYTKKIMVIDDLANRQHDCDLLLDQNYINNKLRYNDLLLPYTIKLLGPKYALLRKEFIGNKNNRKQSYTIKRVFVFFGGTDPNNLTRLALKVLTQPKLKYLLSDVVIGSSNPHQSELKKEVEKYSNIKLHIQIDNIAELMSKTDLALGAGGATTWERIALGLPSIVVTIADNQVAFTKDLDKDGYINWIGSSDQLNEQTLYDALLKAINNSNQLQEQSLKCKKLVNGQGAEIVSKLLTVGPDPETLLVRRANRSDASLYWHWANDSTVRKNAFNEDHIEWQQHQEWFNNKLNDPDTILLLIESSFAPIGQVRFDRKGSHYITDYSLAKQFRGFNLAKTVLSLAIDYLRRENAFTLIGEVKENNAASKKVFENLGFIESTPPPRKAVSCFQLQFYPMIQHG